MNNNLTINDIGKRVVKLKEEIRKVLNTFTEETGCIVEDLSATKIIEIGSNAPANYQVDAKILLGE